MTDRDHADDVDHDEEFDGDDEDPGWPWSFILLVVAGALYLLFRFVELALNLFT